MGVTFDQVESVLESVWESIVDLRYENDFEKVHAPRTGTYVLGTVVLGGKGNYSVALSSTYAAARHVAGRMYRVDAASVALHQVCDAYGEVVNVLAGNLKAMLGGHHEISLPTVRKATAADCEANNTIYEVHFTSDGFEFLAAWRGDET